MSQELEDIGVSRTAGMKLEFSARLLGTYPQKGLKLEEQLWLCHQCVDHNLTVTLDIWVIYASMHMSTRGSSKGLQKDCDGSVLLFQCQSSFKMLVLISNVD